MNEFANYTYRGGEGEEHSKTSLLAQHVKQAMEACKVNIEGEATENTLESRANANSDRIGAFPLSVFPKRIRRIILDMVEYGGFKTVYYATSLLAAAAAAVGNGVKLAVDGNWTVPSSLYVLIVGRAGWGKTPPMNAAFAPFVQLNSDAMNRFQREMVEYRLATAKGDTPMAEPELKLSMISDATIESLKKALAANPNGLVDVYDEIMGWLNYYEECYARAMSSFNRLGQGSMETDVLDSLPEGVFSHKDAEEVFTTLGISRASGYRALRNLVNWEVVERVERGVYRRREAW